MLTLFLDSDADVDSVIALSATNAIKDLTAQVEIKTAATAALSREEWLEKTGECCQISGLNQQLTWANKLGYDSFTTHHTAKETGRGLS